MFDPGKEEAAGARHSMKSFGGGRRYSPEDIARLKKNVSIVELCAERGIELVKHGTSDYKGRCPLHDDEEPSFIVTPEKNLWHCMGCDAGGSVIDLVMNLDGVSFQEAVRKLMNRLPSNGDLEAAEPKQVERTILPGRVQTLLGRTLDVYEKTFAEDSKAKKYLESRGIIDAGLFTKHRIGYANGTLVEILPGNGGVREDLAAVGILLDGNRERFIDCVVFPVFDAEGSITTLYGRYLGYGKMRHLYLPGRSKGLWNAGIVKTYSEIILVESVIDGLSIEMAGFPNVVAVQGTGALNDRAVKLFQTYGVTKITVMFDGDEAGRQASGRTVEKFSSSFRCSSIVLPDGHDPNSFLLQFGAEALRERIGAADHAAVPETTGPADQSGTDSSAEEPAEPTPPDGNGKSAPAGRAPGAGLSFTYGLRRYRVLGLEKGTRKLKATVRVEHGGKLHVDTLDFYSARSRRMLAQDLCRVFEEPSETIEADITRLLTACEQAPTKEAGDESAEPSPHVLTYEERKAAEAFGRRGSLIRRILDDFEACGLVGEEPNKLLSYLAAVSRKMAEPLSVLVLSSSGAGKTALQDTTLAFVPPEDLVKLTSLSGKALFYKERLSLKHKVLALEEGDGAEEADYAIRNLISAGELMIESTVKDLTTGRLTTMANRVEGPTSVFITTTDPETDPETRSRFFVTSIDESREQTRAILAFQRQRHALEGLAVDRKRDETLRVHRNFQRLLAKVSVVNPFADRLAYTDDRLQGRRDQPKYLNLIKAVAFLRQMQKTVKHLPDNGHQPGYIEVDLEDIRIANTLAHEILGRSLDELTRPSRSLLLLLDEMVEDMVAKTAEKRKDEGGQNVPRRTAVTFTRRQIREYTRWSHTRVHRYLKELVDLEYVLIESGRNGTVCRYRLAYEGQGKNGEKFVLGLTDPETLTE